MKKCKRIIGAVLFTAAAIFCILKAADVLERKTSDLKYIPFFEQEEDFDVLLMGTSHMLDGVFPMELWNDYGIVSYNFGGHGNRFATTYWVMQNALDYTTPKLMVIDVLGAGYQEKVSPASDQVHMSLDAFPVSLTKARAVCNLFDDPNAVDENGINTYDHRWEFFYDFGKYHSRWSEITQADWTNDGITKEKGAQSLATVSVPNSYRLLPQTEVLEDSNVSGMIYLRKMIEDCQRRGIEVLLVHIPFPAGKKAQLAANSVYAVAEEYHVDYINFVAMDNVVDYSTDCADPGSHLNSSGARKVTDYIGKYIKEHYDIPDRRTDKKYESWFDDYKAYAAYKAELINSQTALESELMLLADKGFSSCIYVKECSSVLQNQTVYNLLLNLTGKDRLPGLDQAISTQSDYCLVADSNACQCWESADGQPLNINASFGKVSFSVSDDLPVLFLPDSAENRLYGDWSDPKSRVLQPDVQIFVFDNATGEIVSATAWDYSDTASITIREDVQSSEDQQG